MITWKKLNKKLKKKFGKDSFGFYNDKNKYTRRIKIMGANRYIIKEYLETKYNMVIWETQSPEYYSRRYDGICFNLHH